MKVNLIGMILNKCGTRHFDGFVLDDNGKHLDAVEALHYLIMEYAKVANGGESEVVAWSREMEQKP